jgi:hypothetical protein
MLRVRPGAAATAIGWTLGVFDCGTEAVAPTPGAPGGALPEPGLLIGLLAGAAGLVWDSAAGVPPPPPHPAKVAQTSRRT